MCSLKPSHKESFKLTCLHCEFCQIFREEIMAILHKLYQKIEEKGLLPKTLVRPIFSLSKLDKGITRKENYRPKSLVNTDARILNKILAYEIQQCIKR